jgi:flagella basal body P-ring formation protein FlgA
VSLLDALRIAACAWAAAATPLAAAAQGSGAALAPALEAYLRERAAEPVLRVELPPLDGLARDAAREGRELRFSLAPEQPVLGTVPVGVSVWKGDALEHKTVVTAQVVVSRPTVVARRTLAAGSVIAADDVSVEERAVSSPHADALSDPAAAVSRKLRRSVRAGEPLRAQLLTDATAVRRGDRVKLRLEHGALRIETSGWASESGGVGDWIRVRNVTSQREVLGRIGADGVVHVEM